MPERRTPAILLGGEAMAVSVARTLGRMGVPVHAVGDSTWDQVGRSRYCTSFVDLGGASLDVRLDWLERRAPRPAVLLPCDDEGLELVAHHRPRLVELGFLPVEANDEVLLAMLDKHRTYELARQVGVRAPKTVTVRESTDVQSAVEQIGFPCALKPLHSHLFARHFSVRKKVWVVEDEVELQAELGRMVELGLEMLVTEILPGGDDQFFSYYSYLDENGEPLFHFTKHKYRQYPVGFGLATYHRSHWDAQVAELGLRFLQGVGLRGIGNVEFKRDPRDGGLSLIECNHRFTAANDLVRRAGIDVARLAYARLTGGTLPPLDGFRENVHLWHPVEDVRALREYRRQGTLTLGRWLSTLAHPQHFPLFDLRDPKPSLGSWMRMGRHALGRVS